MNGLWLIKVIGEVFFETKSGDLFIGYLYLETALVREWGDAGSILRFIGESNHSRIVLGEEDGAIRGNALNRAFARIHQRWNLLPEFSEGIPRPHLPFRQFLHMLPSIFSNKINKYANFYARGMSFICICPQ